MSENPQIDLRSERVERLIDATGPLRWLNDDTLMGRHRLVKGRLLVSRFTATEEICRHVYIGFDASIDFIGAPYGNDYDMVTVVSYSVKLFSLINVITGRVIVSGTTQPVALYNGYADRNDSGYYSPNYKRYVHRFVEEFEKRPELRLYKVVA